MTIVGDTIEEAVAGAIHARGSLFKATRDDMLIPRNIKCLGNIPKAAWQSIVTFED